MYATYLWSYITNLKTCKQWKYLEDIEIKKESWVFDNALVTDGVSISFQIIKESKFGRKDRIKKKEKKEQDNEPEFPSDITSEEIKAFKILGLDPGKKDILTVTDGIKTITYTIGKRNGDTFKRSRTKASFCTRKRFGVLEYESRCMNLYCKRSCHFHIFARYVCIRKRQEVALSKCYQEKRFRELKYLTFVKQKSSEDRFADRLFKTYKKTNTLEKPCCDATILENARKEVLSPKHILIGWGNWGKSPNALKAGCPTPGIGIRRRFAAYFQTSTIDEKYTSKTCPYCKHVSLENPGRDEGISVKRHHLLRCTNGNCSSRWWNRNVAGSFNILHRALKLDETCSGTKLQKSG